MEMRYAAAVPSAGVTSDCRRPAQGDEGTMITDGLRAVWIWPDR